MPLIPATKPPFWSYSLFAEGDRVVGRYSLRGTHQGEFFGIPATGNSISVSNIHIMRIMDGKIVEH
jgi:predicted ester cyclase